MEISFEQNVPLLLKRIDLTRVCNFILNGTLLNQGNYSMLQNYLQENQL